MERKVRKSWEVHGGGAELGVGSTPTGSVAVTG